MLRFRVKLDPWPCSENKNYHLNSVHMDRFAHASIYLRIRKFAYVCKLEHVCALTHVSKRYSIYKRFTFALGREQEQISICIYANFTHVQMWSCIRYVELLL